MNFGKEGSLLVFFFFFFSGRGSSGAWPRRDLSSIWPWEVCTGRMNPMLLVEFLLVEKEDYSLAEKVNSIGWEFVYQRGRLQFG